MREIFTEISYYNAWWMDEVLMAIGLPHVMFCVEGNTGIKV